MSDFNGIRIALWEVNSDNPNSPKFNGIVTIDGKEHKVSLWDNSNASHPRAPRLKGKTSRPSPKGDVSMNTDTFVTSGGIELPF
jgi:hypothetical protein